MLACVIIPVVAAVAVVDTATRAAAAAADTSSARSFPLALRRQDGDDVPARVSCAGDCRRRRTLHDDVRGGYAEKPRVTVVEDMYGTEGNVTGGYVIPRVGRVADDHDGEDPADDKQVLPDGAARMAEDLEVDDEDSHGDGDEGDAARGRAAVEARRKKLRRVGGAVLQLMVMLKMMPVMLISTKVAILSFLVQIKSLVLSFISVAIAGVQFFWRIQEKRQRAELPGVGAVGGLLSAPAPGGWELPATWPDRRKYISH